MELQISAPVSNFVRQEDERDLVERAKRDREAFAVLYRRHYQAIAGYIYRRVGDAHVTEDLVAEVFLSALRALPRFRYRGVPIKAWLYRIATNRLNHWARQQRRRAITQLDSEVIDQTGEPVDAGLTREHTRAALLTLAPKHQAVLALRYLEGMSVEDVALATGCRVGTGKSRLSRGRDALRRRLRQRS